MVISAYEDHAAPKVTGANAWLPAIRIYLAIIAVGDLLWEAAHLPLYTIWTTGTMREQAFAVVHCTGGDLLIATSSLVISLILVWDTQWPGRRFWHVAGLTMLLGVGSSSTVRRDRHFLTVFSLIPKRRASSADEACDRCSSARTACVVLALP